MAGNKILKSVSFKHFQRETKLTKTGSKHINLVPSDFFILSCRADLYSCRQRRQQCVVLLFLAGGEGEELSRSLGSSTAWAAAGIMALQHLLTESKWRKHLALDSSAVGML